MKLISLNVALPRIVEYDGGPVATGIFKEPVAGPVTIRRLNLEGDRQATRITVEIQAGGRSLVRVTDDGLGMSRDDALLCLERHAVTAQSVAPVPSVRVSCGKSEHPRTIARHPDRNAWL